MSEVRCSHCGNDNPPGVEVCQHCQTPFEEPHSPVTPANVPPEGPLSDLGDIIPIEPIVNEITKPNPYSVKVRVTESQRANVRLLENLMKEEVRPPSREKTPGITLQHVLRILIALALLLAISWGIIFETPSLPFPSADPRIAEFNQYIISLPEGAPVLLAFEYEPGFSSELEPSTTIILDQLLSRGAYPTLVSTTPTGAIQGQRSIGLLNQIAASFYQAPGDYINLGYIPGGATGLNSFTAGIRSTFPLGINGDQVWALPPLQNVNSLSDFNLVIVVTDSTETARAWIEQVGTNLQDTPLLMVASAQAEPLISPYYDSDPRQVEGLIAGLAGSVAYETYTGQINVSRPLWGAFSMSVMVAAGLILFGGLISVIGATYKREGEGPAGR